jgi:MFS family permease
MLIMPVVALFYNENGLDTFDIYLLQAIYSFSVAFFELPSGYLGDIIGRRRSLMIGSFLGAIGFVVQSSSSSLPGFACAQIILGLGGSFISGSDSALLFDSLAAMKRQNYYLGYEGRITALGHLGETVAAIGGGLIAAWLGYRSVYVCQTMIAAIAIPSSLLLIEPPRKKLAARPSLAQIIDISRRSLFEDKKLSSTILISSVAGLATLCMAWTCQIYFITVGFSEIQITPLWVLFNLTVAAVSAYTVKVVNTIGQKRAIIIIIAVMPLSYILLGILPLIPALFTIYLFYLVRGYTTPLLRDLTNNNCGSEIRATVLSMRSLLVRISFSIAGPAIGYCSAATSLSTGLIVFGTALLAGFLPAGLFLLRIHYSK